MIWSAGAATMTMEHSTTDLNSQSDSSTDSDFQTSFLDNRR